MKKLLLLLIAVVALWTAGITHADFVSDKLSEGYYWKNSQLCLRADVSKTESRETCWKEKTIDYSSDVCTQKLEKVDHSEEIEQLKKKIIALESDYRTVSLCNTVNKTKTVWVDSVTVYVYKVVNKVKVVVEKFVLPYTGAR